MKVNLSRGHVANALEPIYPRHPPVVEVIPDVKTSQVNKKVTSPIDHRYVCCNWDCKMNKSEKRPGLAPITIWWLYVWPTMSKYVRILIVIIKITSGNYSIPPLLATLMAMNNQLIGRTYVELKRSFMLLESSTGTDVQLLRARLSFQKTSQKFKLLQHQD